MPDINTAFVGSIPENYDRYMGPMFFEPYARDLVARLKVPPGSRILEVACGTGIVTYLLRETMAADVEIVATDLNDAMLEYAVGKSRGAANIEWKQADAMELRFDDGSFDAVVCQFGLMFVPDKSKAAAEAFRVLKPGGVFLFSTWDKLEVNEISAVVDQTVSKAFPDDPPKFYEVPFSLHDPAAIESMLRSAGFTGIESVKVKLRSHSPSGMDAAHGLIEGTPMLVAINERDSERVPSTVAAVANSLDARFGSPIDGDMSAFVFKAMR